MNSILFHIGTHKCATSAVQLALRSATQEDTDVIYRDVKDLDALQKKIIELSQKTFSQSKINKVADEILRVFDTPAKNSYLILSNENFLGRMLGLNWKFYQHADQLRNLIDRVAENVPTKVFLQSRETSSYLLSSYKFRVRHGSKLSYEQFLQKCDLESVSWMNLGKTMFDGGKFNWRVLPIEYLRTEATYDYVASCATFLYPKWGTDKHSFPKDNAGIGQLATHAVHHLNKMGFKVTTRSDSPIYNSMYRLESEIKKDKQYEQVSVDLIQNELRSINYNVGNRVCGAIFHDYLFSLQNFRSLDNLLCMHFADDYENFLRTYVQLKA